MNDATARVAFLGLGEMGLPMARNLVKAGFQVVGYDLRADRADGLAATGGRRASSPADAAATASAVVVMPFDDAQCREALFGENGALVTLGAGGLVVVMATIGQGAMRDIGARVAERGFAVVDAPVTGGTHGAEGGSLTIIAAGATDALDRAAPLLEAMSEVVYRVGAEPGAGQFVKLVNQLLVGVHLAATAEAMAMGAAAGVDLHQMYEVLCHGFGRSDVFVRRAKAVLDGDLRTGGSVAIFLKDLSLVMETAHALGVPAFTAANALQFVQLGSALGHAGDDDASLIAALMELASPRRV